jgi:hypothetical protein
VCGRYGALWPKPTGDVDLGSQLASFNFDDISFKLETSKYPVDVHVNGDALEDAMTQSWTIFTKNIRSLIPSGISRLYKQVQRGSEYQTNPVLKWSILPRSGHLITGPLKKRTYLSSFRIVAKLRRFIYVQYKSVIKRIFFCLKWSSLAEKINQTGFQMPETFENQFSNVDRHSKTGNGNVRYSNGSGIQMSGFQIPTVLLIIILVQSTSQIRTLKSGRLLKT